MKRIYFSIVMFLALILIAPANVLAFSAVNKKVICSSGSAASSALCTAPSSNEIYGANGAILKVAHILAAVAGVAAIFLIVAAGFRMVISGGDPKAISGARNTIIYAVVGLIIIAVSSAILELIVDNIH